MIDFKVLSHSAYLYTICRDAANTWEVDTPVKTPNVLLNSFLAVQVLIPLSLFMICLYDVVKPIENLVNIIIVGWFIQLYV